MRSRLHPHFYNRQTFSKLKRPAIKHPAANSNATLTIQNLQFAYPERQLFSHITASLLAGVNLIRGGDGRGKSTLLRLLAGALPADGGSLKINQISLKEQPAAYRQQLFWTEARSDSFDQLTPPEYFKIQRKRWPGFDGQRLVELIKGLDLEVHLHKQLFMLSTGSKRKVWLAAAFASGAAVTLIDEPFAALDAPSIRFVIELLKHAAAQQERVFVVADYEAPGDVALAGLIDLGD